MERRALFILNWLGAAALTTSLLSACDSGPSAEEHYQLAWDKHKAGELRTAVVHLKNALAENPDYGDARELLGRTYVLLGLGELAEKELEHAARLGYSGGDFEDYLMRALLLQRRYQDVLNRLDKDWTTIDAVVSLTAGGIAELGLGNLERSQDLFRQALQLDPASVDARRSLVTALIAGGEREAGMAELETLLAQSPEDQRSWLLAATIAERDDRLDDAMQAYDKALAINQDLATARIGVARVHLRRQQPDEALAALQPLAKAGVSTPNLLHLRGVARLQQGDERAARGDLLEALKLDGNLSPSLYTMGLLEYRDAQYLTAEDYLRRYIAVTSGTVDGLMLLAAVHIAQEDYEAARSQLQSAAAREPESAEIQAMLGVAQNRAGDAAAAARSFQNAVELEPDIASYRLQLGSQYLAAGDSEKALPALIKAEELDPELFAAGYLAGYAQLRSGDTAAAREQALTMTAGEPDDALGWQLLGLVNKTEGDNEAARRSFDNAYALDDGLVVTVLELARLDHLDGDLEAAQQRLAGLLAQEETSLDTADVVVLRRQLARLALAMGQLTVARNEYEKLLQVDPTDTEALLSVAQLPTQEARMAERIALLEKARASSASSLTSRNFLTAYYLAQERFEEAVAVAREAVALAPDNPIAVTLLGRALGGSGQWQAAEETLGRAAELRSDKAAPLVEYGRWAVLNKHFEKAREAFDAALKREPDSLEAAVARAGWEAAVGDAGKARDMARRLQTSHPDAADGYNIEAAIAREEGELETAVSLLGRAMQLAPNAQQLAYLFDTLNDSGKPGAAFEQLEDYAARKPDDARSRALVAGIYAASGRYPDAIRHFAALASQRPGDVSVLNELAWAQYKGGRLDEAATNARRAVELAPDRPLYADTYGWILVQQGQLEQALSLISRAAAAAEDNATIRYHHAYTLWKLGQRQQAAREVEAALGLEGSFPERAEAEELRSLLAGS